MDIKDISQVTNIRALKTLRTKLRKDQRYRFLVIYIDTRLKLLKQAHQQKANSIALTRMLKFYKDKGVI